MNTKRLRKASGRTKHDIDEARNQRDLQFHLRAPTVIKFHIDFPRRVLAALLSDHQMCLRTVVGAGENTKG